MSNNLFGLVLEGFHLLESASHQVEFLAALTPEWVSAAAPYALGAMGARLLWAALGPVSYIGEGVANGVAFTGNAIASGCRKLRAIQKSAERKLATATKTFARRAVAVAVRLARKALRRDKQ